MVNLEQEEPKYKVGEWLYSNNTINEILFRCGIIKENYYSTDEYYVFNLNTNVLIINEGKSDKFSSVETNTNITKATTKQIESVLTKVAIHKGFLEGVKYKNILNGITRTIKSEDEYSYNRFFDSLDNSGGCVYNKGKWATIIEEEKEIIDSQLANAKFKVESNLTWNDDLVIKYSNYLKNQKKLSPTEWLKNYNKW